MSVLFYDKAVTAKIKKLFSNTVYQNRNFLFHTVTDKGGSVKFPLIGVYRPDGWGISKDNSWIQTINYLLGIREIKIDISYQIDLYANTREDLEEITAELVLYLLRNPGIVVHYESVDKSLAMDIKTYLKYVSGPEKTSEPDDTTVGRFYRNTLVFSLDAAKLINFAGEHPGEDGYTTEITTVLVDIVTKEANVNLESETHNTNYSDKEEIYGKN